MYFDVEVEGREESFHDLPVNKRCNSLGMNSGSKSLAPVLCLVISTKNIDIDFFVYSGSNRDECKIPSSPRCYYFFFLPKMCH